MPNLIVFFGLRLSAKCVICEVYMQQIVEREVKDRERERGKEREREMYSIAGQGYSYDVTLKCQGFTLEND